jgi:hypothetical protein
MTSVLLPGCLYAIKKDWFSRLNSPRGVTLKELVSTNACIVHRPDSHTTILSYPTVIPDVLDIIVVKEFVLLANLAVCSALS